MTEKFYSCTIEYTNTDIFYRKENLMDSSHYQDIPFELIINKAVVLDPSLDRQGSYTRKDLMEFPAHKRMQLINGYLILPSPVSAIHQRIIAELLYQWTNYIKEAQLPYKAVTSPVRFSRKGDDRTVLIPDFAVVRYPGRILHADLSVLPSFVAEVTTPGTNCLDHLIKPRIYKEWGVREYWIINPQTSSVEVYTFTDSASDSPGPAAVYPFGSRIPVKSHTGFSVYSV